MSPKISLSNLLLQLVLSVVIYDQTACPAHTSGVSFEACTVACAQERLLSVPCLLTQIGLKEEAASAEELATAKEAASAAQLALQ